VPRPRLGQEENDLRGQARRRGLPGKGARLGEGVGRGEVGLFLFDDGRRLEERLVVAAIAAAVAAVVDFAGPPAAAAGYGAGHDAQGEVSGEEAGEVLHDGLLRSFLFR